MPSLQRTPLLSSSNLIDVVGGRMQNRTLHPCGEDGKGTKLACRSCPFQYC